MKIGKKAISLENPPYIIAEIGTNHNRSLEIAKKLIDVAASCKADAVKFQIYEPEDIVNPSILSKEYGFQRIYKEKYVIDIFEKYLKTPKSWIPKLSEYARKKKLDLVAAVHSSRDARFILGHNFDALKIASMELSNTVLLKQIAEITDKPVILSTGMSLLPEIVKAVKIFKENDKHSALLHCVSVYPPKFEEMHLNNIKVLSSMFDIPVGYSDHSPTNESVFSAIALGARIIEKHITLDRKSPGPDHPFALEKEGLKDLVEGCRNIFYALGQDQFNPPSKRELANRDLSRKSIVASKDIKAGERISKTFLTFARPGTGIQPADIKQVEGKAAKKAIKKGALVSWDHIR